MNITVVIVTFNRLECLKLALDKFTKQLYLPKRIIVVDNKSTDGTDDYLQDWQSKQENYERVVVTTKENLGGAGGFATGLKKAIEYTDTDWIWLSDDDAYVKENTLYEIQKVYTTYLKSKNNAALFTSVVNKGKYDLDHRRRVKKTLTGLKLIPVNASEYQKPYFSIAQGSYVGMLVNTEFVKKYGVTREDFFIYYDDTEHCERLRRHGALYCIPNAKVEHDTMVDSNISWKTYYGFRNSTILFREYYGFFYAIMNVIKRYIKHISPLSRDKYSKKCRIMLKAGLWDGINKKVGLHDVYKPGWKIDE